MITSTKHVLPKAKWSHQLFCLRRQNSSGRYFASEGKTDKFANCLAGQFEIK